MSYRITFRCTLLLVASVLLWDSGSAWAQDSTDDLGRRLHAAAETCDLESVRNLVAQGANVNYLAPTLSGGVQTPLQAAILGVNCLVAGDQVPVVEFLLGHRAGIDDPAAGPALQAALMAHRNDGQSADQLRVVQMLLDRGADVKARVRLSDGSTSTLLQTALASLNDSDAIVADFVKKDMARILKRAGAR